MKKKRERLNIIWSDMKQRCVPKGTPTTKQYGDRGITVCDEWKKSYKAFKDWALENGYSDSLTLDRIDPDGGYNPDNCRFISYKEQALNKRNNRYVTIGGVTKLLTEWCSEYHITPTTVYRRVRDEGWSFQKAVMTPPQRTRSLHPDITDRLYDKIRIPVICIFPDGSRKHYRSLKDTERDGYVRRAVSKATKTGKQYRGCYWKCTAETEAINENCFAE